MKTPFESKPDPRKEQAISTFLFLILFISALLLFSYEKNEKPALTKYETASRQQAIEGVDQGRFDSIDLMFPHRIDDPMVPEQDHEKPSAKIPSHGISPPVPQYNVPLTRKQVNAAVGEIITTRSKSQIMIPPRAFLDSYGKPVEGKVDVSYREFRDFRDIFLSGIPMKYDSGDVNGMLESAGMMELVASKDNQPVYVNPESRIRVMLASAMKSDDYNLYYYDKKENKWAYKGKDEVVLKAAGEGVSKQAPARGPGFRFNFNAEKYVVRLQCVSDMRDHRKYFFSPKKSPTVFDFRFATTTNLYPELKELRRITWRYLALDAPDVFAKIFGIPKEGQGTYISRTFDGTAELTVDSTREDSPYRVHLVLDSQDMTFPVEPVIESPSRRKVFENKWAQYTWAKQDRVNSVWSDYEKFKKDSAAFNDKFAGESASIFSAQTVALRTFQIDGFGIWNVDKQFSPSAANSVAAFFTDEHGRRLKFDTGYMVETGRNSVFTLTNFSQFRFDPDSKNIFWAVLEGNRLAIIYPDEFARHKRDKSGSCTFTMKVSNNALDSYANLREALSFN